MKVKALEAKRDQEAEAMRQLGNSLFGALYAPLELGTETVVSVRDQDAPLFFMDRLPVMVRMTCLFMRRTQAMKMRGLIRAGSLPGCMRRRGLR